MNKQLETRKDELITRITNLYQHYDTQPYMTNELTIQRSDAVAMKIECVLLDEGAILDKMQELYRK